jgi:hypothetical protein
MMALLAAQAAVLSIQVYALAWMQFHITLSGFGIFTSTITE